MSSEGCRKEKYPGRLGRREFVGIGAGGKGLETGWKGGCRELGSGNLRLVFSPGMVFNLAHILSSLVQISKAQEGVPGGQSLPLSCGNGLRRRRRRSWFLQPLKRGEPSASHQDYARRRKPKGLCY